LIHAETRITTLQTQPRGDRLLDAVKPLKHERQRDGDVACLETSATLSHYRPSTVRLDLVRAENQTGRSLDLTARTVPNREMKDDT
jgi:hypothetical protein